MSGRTFACGPLAPNTFCPGIVLSLLRGPSIARLALSPKSACVATNRLSMTLTSKVRDRIVMLVAALILLVPLGIAAWLTPAASGLGTHQQLGLPPCSMRLWFNMRCPACGMTTSWAWLVRGQLISSLQSNAAGTLLAVLDLWTAGGLIWFSWSGDRPSANWLKATVMALAGAMLLAVAIWLWRLMSDG